MSGYTPVFDSVFHGTLCGRWPTLPVWLTILPLADKYGHIDITHQAISALTGWPLDLLKQAIAELQEPDPNSRTFGEEGRRLVLLDPEHRQWGWRVVNHSQYRERARKQMQQIQATESGRDAERKRIERERQRLDAHGIASGDVQLRPAESGPDRLSDSDSDSDSDAEKNSGVLEDSDSRPRRARTRRDRPAYEAKEFHAKVIEAYHELLGCLPGIRDWNETRQRKLNTRIAERLTAGKPADGLLYWRDLFAKVAASDFLTGRKTDWRCLGLEWLLERANFTKLIEGSYDNPRGNGASNGR
jgi:hypothetical protein